MPCLDMCVWTCLDMSGHVRTRWTQVPCMRKYMLWRPLRERIAKICAPPNHTIPVCSLRAFGRSRNATTHRQSAVPVRSRAYLPWCCAGGESATAKCKERYRDRAQTHMYAWSHAHTKLTKHTPSAHAQNQSPCLQVEAPHQLDRSPCQALPSC